MAIVAYGNHGIMRSDQAFTGAGGNAIDDSLVAIADIFESRRTINVLRPGHGLTAAVPDSYFVDVNGNTTGSNNLAAIQAMLDFCHEYGYWLYFPTPSGANAGRGYGFTGSLHLDWEDAGAGGGLAGILGDGYDRSLLIGRSVAAGREALELYAVGNDGWRTILRGFKIICDATCAGGNHDAQGSYEEVYTAAGSSCLGFGDARDSCLIDRCAFEGFNGVALRTSTSASYAQIGTRFQHCLIITNPSGSLDLNGYWGHQNTFRGMAVWPKHYGAAWDTVSFHNCTLVGLVHVFAESVTFTDECAFSTPPMRPTGVYNYAGNLVTLGGVLIAEHSNFEDYNTAITAASVVRAIDFMSIRKNHFSGYTASLAPYNKALRAITYNNSVYEIGQVTIEDNQFGYKDHETEAQVFTAATGRCVYGRGAQAHRVQGNVNLYKPSLMTIPNVPAVDALEFDIVDAP